MTDLIPTTAFGTTQPKTATHGALTLAEVVTTALASLSLRQDAQMPASLDVNLPAPGEWTGRAGMMAIWLGPEQWMILGENRAGEDFTAEIATSAPGCSVTEQTDGWVIFTVTSATGSAPVQKLLEKLVNLDSEALAPGRALRTRAEHLGIIVLRRAPDAVMMLGMRSSAESLWHLLDLTAARLA